MFEVKNSNVRRAYEMLNILVHESVPRGGKLESYIADLKRAIRAYNKRQSPDSFIVKEYGIDGYIELYIFPAELDTVTYDEAAEWFDSNRRLHGGDGPYDCTGEKFTQWRHIFRRNGRWYAYHSVGIDI